MSLSRPSFSLPSTLLSPPLPPSHSLLRNQALAGAAQWVARRPADGRVPGSSRSRAHTSAPGASPPVHASLSHLRVPREEGPHPPHSCLPPGPAQRGRPGVHGRVPRLMVAPGLAGRPPPCRPQQGTLISSLHGGTGCALMLGEGLWGAKQGGAWPEAHGTLARGAQFLGYIVSNGGCGASHSPGELTWASRWPDCLAPVWGSPGVRGPQDCLAWTWGPPGLAGLRPGGSQDCLTPGWGAPKIAWPGPGGSQAVLDPLTHRRPARGWHEGDAPARWQEAAPAKGLPLCLHRFSPTAGHSVVSVRLLRPQTRCPASLGQRCCRNTWSLRFPLILRRRDAF